MSKEKTTENLQSAMSISSGGAGGITIPARHLSLLDLFTDFYGTHKRLKEFLEKFHQPHTQSDQLAEELRGISLGDFYKYNFNDQGQLALQILAEIYAELINRENSGPVKEKIIGYFFEYLRKILEDSREHLSRNIPVVLWALDFLRQRPEEESGSMKKITRDLKAILKFFIDAGLQVPVYNLAELSYRAFRASFNFWLQQPDPLREFIEFNGQAEARARYQSLVAPISHDHLRLLLRRLEEAFPPASLENYEAFKIYLELPDYYQIADGYLRIAHELEVAPLDNQRGESFHVDFLLKIISLPALQDIHREALMEINRSFGRALAEKSAPEAEEFIRKMFQVLRENTASSHHTETIFSFINAAAREVFKLNQHSLVNTLIEEIILFGFQSPNIQGTTTDWEVKFNPWHIKNIRSWLEIIRLKPRWTKQLLSALIINLKIGGVFVRDTDLLQKDISALLNSDITPAFNLIMQLARLLPIFFNEINAEGELREVSIRMDDITGRRDPLIHFVRKQSHVESNSRLIPFVEAIVRYWYSGNKEDIRPFLPEEVYEQIEGCSEIYEGMHKIFRVLYKEVHQNPRLFLQWEPSKIQRIIQKIPKVTDDDKEKAILVLRFYQLLYKKYNIHYQDVIKSLQSSYIFDQQKLTSLQKALLRKDYYQSLVILMDFLSLLKERIVSPEKTEAFEDIYHKRHIAAGIPSMYGVYREPKFDALGLYLRLQCLANVLLEQLINSLNIQFITKTTLVKIDKYLRLFIKALQLEGISTEGLESKTKYLQGALQIKRFSLDQYIDIFRFISRGIQDIIRLYYIDPHQANLRIVIRQFLARQYGDKMTSLSREEEEAAVYMQTENFLRSIIASSFGLQTLDNFISNILKTLCAEQEKFKTHSHMLNILMSYNPEIIITPLYKKPQKKDDQILLGNKGYFLKQLYSLSFPVPPGFVLTTEIFRCLEAILGYQEIYQDMNMRLKRELKKLEKITRRRYGHPQNPLLLSVRSGSAISLPGMMSSFLNVGINEEIAEGLSQKKGYAWAAWDCYRRFLQFWGMSEGLDRDFFDEIIDDFKEKYNVSKKLYFTPDQMREIALAYRKALEDSGIAVEDDPPEQLRKAIFKVIESWHSPRAKLYRQEMNISDKWGTAVVVQSMVFGNLDEWSGSGVTFTRDPKGLSSSVLLSGDFIFGGQGDDIVAGLVETYPISEAQRKSEKRDSEISLENKFPAVYAELKRLAEILIYDQGFGHQEIEFTFENNSREGLYILQTRDMPPPERFKLKSFTRTPKLEKSLIGYGIGIGGGALCGRAVFSEQEIKFFSQKEPQTPLILIRPDTVPDDIGLLRQVDGLLTAKGGSTSHAAVIIPQLKKVGVVGLRNLKVYEKNGYSLINGYKINSGDFIGIDGWSGSVYLGKHQIEEKAITPARI
ncbi:MAG TPA: PEP/pyruvate-binding domain-containing protein [Candidatus Saccharicenans sp.]|nr:PEP/pyruvate-binding domain-containing protein [Candidatus Saccharicenans sp.]